MEEAWELAVVNDAPKDKLEVEATVKGLRVKIEGETLKSSSKGIGDLVSPLINYIGDKGDSLAHKRRMNNAIRVYNEQALKFVIEEALQHSTVEGFKPISLKEFVSFSEAASLEDLSDPDNLASIYGKLLATALSSDCPNLLVYSDMLKILNKDHLIILEAMADSAKDWRKHPHESRVLILEEFISTEIQGVDKDDAKEEATSLAIQAFAEKTGCLFIYWNSWEYCGDPECRLKHKLQNPYDDDAKGIMPQLSVLESLRLVDKKSLIDFKVSSKSHVSLEYVHLSYLGVDFLSACGRK